MSLREVMEFYNVRDLEPERWGVTDYPETVNREDMGNLELTPQEIDDLLALMEAFTDRSLLALRDAERPTEDSELPLAPQHVRSTEELKGFFSNWTHRFHPQFEIEEPPESSIGR